MNSYTNRLSQSSAHRTQWHPFIGRPDYTTAYHPRHLATALNNAWQGVVRWLTLGPAPHITREFQGNAEVWRVYDPVTDLTLRFDQENDLRVWLEERYYQ